jgi:hypothetical protein
VTVKVRFMPVFNFLCQERSLLVQNFHPECHQ